VLDWCLTGLDWCLIGALLSWWPHITIGFGVEPDKVSMVHDLVSAEAEQAATLALSFSDNCDRWHHKLNPHSTLHDVLESARAICDCKYEEWEEFDLHVSNLCS
jgi:hypothetical protein